MSTGILLGAQLEMEVQFFWLDQWTNNMLDSTFPRLFSYAKDKLQSVQDFFGKESMLESFHLPLFVQVHDELSSQAYSSKHQSEN
jgi:hypothetical protein